MERYQKVSASLKQHYQKNGHHCSGKSGWKHTDEQKELKRIRAIEAADRKGRVSDEHKKARNKANVYAYRARKLGAIPNDADLTLIKRIYENCPKGYHVDHIIALAVGGKHHQENLQYLPASVNCSKGKSGEYDTSLAIRWQHKINAE